MLELSLSAVVIAFKYGLPLLLAFFPFAAGWANFALDSVDGDILVPLGVPEPTYQLIDKSADWLSYIGMVVAAWWMRWPMRRLILALFLFRSAGQAAFFVTGDELMFFLFPNFLEPLFLVYATIRAFRRADAPASYGRHRLAIWTVVVLYKMQDEYITHVSNVDRTEIIRGLLGS